MTFNEIWNIAERSIHIDDVDQLKKDIGLHPELILSVPAHGWTLLTRTAVFGAFKCMCVLVEAGADIHKVNFNQNALLIAATIGNFRIVQFLLEQGAKLSVRNANGNSAFDIVMEIKSGDRKKNFLWFKLFESYKNQFDQRDFKKYCEYRLPALFD